ncbi:hypothetical protein KUTeg_004915 [Tegillarca granosa]|uniref:SH3 domain-containing protein n=1 Tax=Tegillarca granosa TaxID=220873 RepID=A0ABQ9FK29_TEGGR|nr:hypothetical protein KUTeg_004915 [Tegillarca granosa]
MGSGGVLEMKKKKAKNKTVEKISAPKVAEEYIVIADYVKEDKWDLNLSAGMVVDVLEKSESGWWFVHVEEQQGWVPSTYLERRDGTKDLAFQKFRAGEEEKYICTDEFTADGADEISLDTGAVVEAHMERVAQASGVQVVSTLSDISDLLKDDDQENTEGGDSVVSKKTLPHILKKSHSLERGGSIRPPPRQNTIKNRNNNVQKILPSSSNYVYCTVAEFSDSVGDGISFQTNERVTVLDKTETGWWFVKIGDKEGWAPSSYIEKQEVITVQESFLEEDEDKINLPTQDDHYDDVEENSESGDSDSDDEWDYENQEPTPPPLPRSKPTPTPPVPTTDTGNSITSALKSKFNAPKTDDVLVRPKSSTLSEQNRPNSRGGSGKRPGSKPPPPPPPPAKSIPIGQEKSHDSDISKLHSPGSGGIADALKARFDMKQNNRLSNTNKSAQFGSDSSGPKPSLPPKLPSKPSSATQGQRSPRVSQNIETGSKSDNLADVLKSKFEARQASSESALENVQPPTKPDVKPHAIKPHSLGKQKPTLPFHAHTAPPPAGRPLTPPKKSSLPRTPPKSPITKKDESSGGNSSDLSSVLKAKFEARQSASQETISNDRPPAPLPKKQFPSKPVLPSKGGSDKHVSASPNWSKKNFSKEMSESETKPAAGLASVLKSKFEGGDAAHKPPVVSSRPAIPTKSAAPKPNLPSKTFNKTHSDTKPPPIAKKFNNSENVSKTQPGKIGSGNFAALRAKLEQSKTLTTGIVTNSSPVTPAYNANEKQMETNPVSHDSVNISNQITKPPTLKSTKYVAISDFSADNDGEINLYEGDFVEVVEKSDDWWLVKVGSEEGWAPASYIEEHDGSDNIGVHSPENDSGFTSPSGVCVQESENNFSRFKTTARFVAENAGEIGFSKGEFVEVLEQGDEGWWYISVNGQEGWAPASYIKEM